MPETTPLIKAALNLRVGAGFDVYFLSYLEYRKENGKEVKGKAIGYCIDKLESLSNSPVEQVAIIKQTIQNGWTDFFPLKGKKEKVSGSNVSSWLEREKIKSTGGVFGD